MLFQSVFLLVEFKYFVSRNNGKNVGRYGGRYFYNPNSDNVVFYLQSHNGTPGMFYVIFKVESEPFFDENKDLNYLKDELGKGLSFRILI